MPLRLRLPRFGDAVRLGYVVIEWNQASGRPSLYADTLWDSAEEASSEANLATGENRSRGRLEAFTVAAVDGIDT